MSIYRFADASLVAEIAFRYANDRPPVALVAAAANVDEDQLSTIRRALEGAGWRLYAVTNDLMCFR